MKARTQPETKKTSGDDQIIPEPPAGMCPSDGDEDILTQIAVGN